MAWWFLRGARRGIVTTRYPKRSDSSSVLLPTPPAFDPLLLNLELVRSLVAVCPSRALEEAHGELLLDLGRCTACRRCLEVAGPAGRPSGQFELATREPERLLVRFPVNPSR
jgi:hypothetical protein